MRRMGRDLVRPSDSFILALCAALGAFLIVVADGSVTTIVFVAVLLVLLLAVLGSPSLRS